MKIIPSSSTAVSMDNQSISKEDISEEPKFPMDPKCYKIIQKIGRGKNCTIFRTFCIPMNSYVVIKSINQSGQGPEPVDNRRNNWSILPSFSVAASLQSLMFYSFPNGLPEDCIAVILNQILNQLSSLHANETLHRDINAGNILLDHKGQVQLADFGYSASISELGSLSSSYWSSSQPPLYWVAPEVTQSSDGYSVKADIWSFGILALELLHGKPPLFEIDQLSQSLIKKINERFFLGNYENYKKSSCSDKSFSESFKNLVKGCLEQDPRNRPTLEMLQKHVFFGDCKSADFLVKTMMKGKSKLLTRTDEDDKEKEEVKLRISGWNLKDEKMELCPILYNVPPFGLRETRHVQFGGQTIIEEKEVMEVDEQPEEESEEEENEENQKFGMFLQVSEMMDIISEKMDDVNETTSRDEILATLYFVKDNMEIQLSQVNSLIITHGGVLQDGKCNVLAQPSPEPDSVLQMDHV